MKSDMKRWGYACVGVIVLLFAGLVYAWTVLQAPIEAAFPIWSKGQLSFTFTLTMMGFCLGGFTGGILQKQWKPRILVWTAGIMFFAGFVIVSRANSLIMLYLGFGILGGLACGLVYNIVMSCVSAWFPDKPGFISGLMLMGFGISSFIIGKFYTAVTPSDGSDTWRNTFFMLGIILAAVMFVMGFFIQKPYSNEVISSADKSIKIYEEVETCQMIKRASFWLYMIWATFLSAAGLAIISQGTPMALEACPETEMGTVATIVGLLSIFNGLGRVMFGVLFDKLGRFMAMLFGGILFILAMFFLLGALENHSLSILIIAYIMTGLAYGCVTPTNSAFVNAYYGRKNYPVNLSVVNMNMLVASMGSTMAGAIYDITDSYTAIIWIVIVLISIGTVMSCFIRKPMVRK